MAGSRHVGVSGVPPWRFEHETFQGLLGISKNDKVKKEEVFSPFHLINPLDTGLKGFCINERLGRFPNV